MYSKIFELHAQILKALAHPRRLEIIHLLRDQELCVSDIYEMLDLPQANISQHLTILRDVGVLISKREGKQVYYKLANSKIMTASDLFRDVLIDQQQDGTIADILLLQMKDLVPIVHDPVCLMRVSPKTAAASTEFQNQRYHFCASGCLKKFQEKPEKYVKKQSS